MLKSNIHAKYKYDYVEKQEDGYIYIYITERRSNREVSVSESWESVSAGESPLEMLAIANFNGSPKNGKATTS